MTTAAAPTYTQFIDRLRELRAGGPVLLDPVERTAQVFDHDPCHEVITDFRRFSSDLADLLPRRPEQERLQRGNFVGMDPPQHRALRGLVSRAFTPKMIDDLEPRITEVAADLLDRAGDEYDLVDALAYPLPVIVIAELLGVPAMDLPVFRHWAYVLFDTQDSDKLKLDEAALDAVGPVVTEMGDYFQAFITERRAHPADDLTSHLIAADADGARLDDEQITGFLTLLLLAGHVTTTALLGNSVMIMDENPGIWVELAADRSLVPGAIEEFLRVRPPFPRVVRRTREPVELGGAEIPADHIVMAWLASANRDPHRFGDPDVVDIHRRDDRHVSFGKGIHFCIGAPLARLEARVALNLMLDRYPDLRVSGEPETFNPFSIAAAKTLPVRAG